MEARSPARRRDPHADAAATWQPVPTLAGHEYCSADVFELERRRLFQGTWFCIGRAEDAPHPGSFVVADVAGESVVVIHGDDGTLRAFLNVCRHRGSRLCEGEGTVRAIRCPYHAWSYGLDGRLLATPNVRREEALDRGRLGLVPVALDVWDGFVWVAVAPGAPPLLEHLTRWASDDPFQWSRYAVGSLVVGARREYDVAANWKLLIENYNECLHCPTVHPELTKLVPVYRHGEVEEEPAQTGSGNRLADGVTSFTPRGSSELPRLPGLDRRDHGMFYGLTVLPNLIVNYHSDTVSTFLLLPERADRTRVVCHYLFAPEVARAEGFDTSEVVDFRHRLALEDWAVCERAQRGAGSRGYAEGGVLPYADRFLHAFHRSYREMLGAGGRPD
jgi:glycine betaine catabolism A